MNTTTKQPMPTTRESLSTLVENTGLARQKLRLATIVKRYPKIIKTLSTLTIAGGSVLSIAGAAFLLRNKIAHIKMTATQKPKEVISKHLSPQETDETQAEKEDLNGKKTRLMSLIKTIPPASYMLHRTGNITTEERIYHACTPIKKKKDATHYTEYYYQDLAKKTLILKVNISEHQTTDPIITWFIIHENFSQDLNSILSKKKSFLRQTDNASRFKQTPEEGLMPEEIFIANEFYATYTNGILTEIVSLNQSNDELEAPSPHSLSTEMLSDNSVLAAEGSSEPSAASTEFQAPWDPESSTPTDSYFKLRWEQLKEISLQTANNFIELIKNTSDNDYQTITPLHQINESMLSIDSHILKAYIQSPEEFLHIFNDCTHYTEEYAAYQDYLLLKTSLCNSAGFPYKTIINIIQNNNSDFVNNHTQGRTRTIFNMFLEYRTAHEYEDLLSCTYTSKTNISISSLTMMHPTLHEKMNITFDSNPKPLSVRSIRITQSVETHLFMKTLLRRGDSITPEKTTEFVTHVVIQNKNPINGQYHTAYDEGYQVNGQDNSLNTVEITIPHLLIYRSILGKKRLWRNAMMLNFGVKSTCTWTSTIPFKKSTNAELTEKILHAIQNPAQILSPQPVSIASKLLNYMPQTLPPLPTGASLASKIALNDLSDMYKSFQKIYTLINKRDNNARLQAENILNLHLTENEQVSLLINASIISSELTKKLTSGHLSEAQSNVLATFITSIETFNQQEKKSVDGFPVRLFDLYQKQKSRMARHKPAPYPEKTLSDLIVAMIERITLIWHAIPIKDRTAFFDSLTTCYQNLKIRELTNNCAMLLQNYIPLEEYINIYKCSPEKASQMNATLATCLEECSQETKQIFAPYQEALRQRSDNLPYDSKNIVYNPLLDLIHVYMRITRPSLRSISHIIEQYPAEIATFTTRSLPDIPLEPTTIQDSIPQAFVVHIIQVIHFEFLSYCVSLESRGKENEKALLAIIKPALENMLESIYTQSLKESLAAIAHFSECFDAFINENAEQISLICDHYQHKGNLHSKEKSTEQLKQDIYCLIVEQLYNILKPQHTNSVVDTFLNCRKKSLIQAIKANQLTNYLTKTINTCLTYTTEYTNSSHSNGIILCTLQPAGLILTQSALVTINTIVKNIKDKKNKKAMKDFLVSLIPVYNACVPLINYYIKLIERVANTLSIQFLEDLMDIVQNILWYFS